MNATADDMPAGYSLVPFEQAEDLPRLIGASTNPGAGNASWASHDGTTPAAVYGSAWSAGNDTLVVLSFRFASDADRRAWMAGPGVCDEQLRSLYKGNHATLVVAFDPAQADDVRLVATRIRERVGGHEGCDGPWF